MTLSLVKTISPFIITVGSLILNHETGIQSSACLACLAWRFLDKLSELRKRGNRNNKPQGREEPGRETTEKPLHSRSKKQLKPSSYTGYYLSNSEFEFERTHEKSLTTRLEFILLFLLIAIYIVEQFEYIECERRLKTHYTT